jgi:hypothetical protein
MKRIFQGVLPFVLVSVLAANCSAVVGKWTGTLGPAPADAKEGVVATLTFKEGDKDVVLNLTAEGDVAKALKDGATKNLKVTVHGGRTDATTVKVTGIEKAE